MIVRHYRSVKRKMVDSFQREYRQYTFVSAVGLPFGKHHARLKKTENVRKHVLIQSFSSICENIPHLEYSGGPSFTSVRIHDITSDGELKGQEV